MKKWALKKILVLGSLLSIFAFGGFYMVEYTFPKMCIKPWRLVPSENKWRFPEGYLPENYGLTGEKMSIITEDGLNLSAWLLKSNLDTTLATIVLLHGISNCKESNFPRARILADSGYASLLLDLRAHGASAGTYCTFGYYEKNDLKTVADTLTKRNPDRILGIWGNSLGGAIALQALAHDARYSFGIIESTFDEYPKVIAEYGADFMFGLRPQWILNRVIYKAGAKAHFDPYTVDPVKAAAKSDQPLLFMHGDKDARIPMSFNKRNFEVAPNPGKKWVTVHGAGHNNLWTIDGAHLKKEVYSFLYARRAAK